MAWSRVAFGNSLPLVACSSRMAPGVLPSSELIWEARCLMSLAVFSVFSARAVSPRERAILASGDADGRPLIQSWIN